MKLLVTTDFSANSKGAIRFALTLAKQKENIEIIFYHAIHILKPTLWNESFFNSYQKEEIERITTDLKKFVYATIGKNKEKFDNFKFVIDNSFSIEKDIILYAEKNKINFICIATQGAGMLRKVMGTHTSYIVTNSNVPVFVIPSHYRAKPIKKATYLSDFENLKSEINIISKFSNEIDIILEVLHYKSRVQGINIIEKNKELLNSKEFENIKLNIRENILNLSIIDRVADYVQKSKPELLIMFTKREKSFFETMFLPSKSAELTYTTKVPVLIFSK